MRFHNNIFSMDDYSYIIKERDELKKGKLFYLLKESQENNTDFLLNISISILKYKDYINSIEFTKQDEILPYWTNGWIVHIDGVMIYSLLASLNPRYYVEVGSGNTTKFAAKAIRDHALSTKIISIDPKPRAEIDNLCNTVIRKRLEDTELDFFRSLTSRDILIVDNSHRVYPNSDVMAFFTLILPTLPKGLIYAIHDIALPGESFINRLYTEQYMLAAYLLGGASGDKIIFPTAYISEYHNVLHKIHETNFLKKGIYLPSKSGFFWMQKG